MKPRTSLYAISVSCILALAWLPSVAADRQIAITIRDLQTRREAEAFLVDRGYRIAPVTLDAWDWMYAGVYDDARRRGDSALQQQLVSSYLSYTNDVLAYSEKQSKDLIGYELKQILLLHAN